MRRMRTDWNAIGEILAGAGGIVATLIATPIKKQLLKADAAPELRAVLAKAREQHIGWAHRGCYPNRHPLLPERGGIGAEPAGTLQGNGLGIEGPRQDHGTIEGNKFGWILGKRWQWCHRLARRAQVPARLDAELGEHRHGRPAGRKNEYRVKCLCDEPIPSELT